MILQKQWNIRQVQGANVGLGRYHEITLSINNAERIFAVSETPYNQVVPSDCFTGADVNYECFNALTFYVVPDLDNIPQPSINDHILVYMHGNIINTEEFTYIAIEESTYPNAYKLKGAYVEDNSATVQSDLDIPVFERGDDDAINNYVATGDDSGAVNYTSLHSNKYTDFTVYFDGNKKPIIKITWQPKNDSEIQPETVAWQFSSPNFATGVYNGETPYTDGNMTFQYDAILQNLKGLASGPIPISLYIDLYTYMATESGTRIATGSVQVLSDAPLLGDYKYSVTNSPSDDGYNTVTVQRGTGADDSGYSSPSSRNDDTSKTNQGASGIGKLTKTYKMTAERLQALGNFLWGGTFFDDIHKINNSPLENVVSIKGIPFNASGVEEEIKIGNVDTSVFGDKVTAGKFSFESQHITVPSWYNSFLDMSPYTTIHIYLPYCGMIPLDASSLIGRKIYVEYIYDLIVGTALANVYCDLNGNGHYTMISTNNCDIGVDIPLASSNRTQIEAGIVGAIGSATLDAVATGGASLVNDGMNLLNSALAPFHTTTAGGVSPQCYTFLTNVIYLIIDRPVADIPSNFEHYNGRVCRLTKTIKDLRGFTQMESFDLHGIKATSEEIEMIESALKDGFYA